MLQRKKTTKKRRKTRKSSQRIFQSVQSTTLLKILVLFVLGGLLIGASNQISTAEEPDERIDRVNTYFSEINAPLAGHGETFVRVADACNMDWRLLPAIAMQESTGGKFMMNNNPFGWGSAEIPFESIDDAIMNVGWNLCGHNPNTSQWYSTTSTYEKLYRYNGTVAPTYPAEVMWIMDQI